MARGMARIAAAQTEVGKAGLGNAGMFHFLVRAVEIERLGSEDADDGAKNVRLFKVNVDKSGRLALDVINGLANGGDG